MVTVYPGAKRFAGWAKETTPGTAVAPTATMPVESIDPDPQITWLDDTALRGSMVELYGRYPGPQMGGLDLKGPVFGDTIGHPLQNLLGDYAVTGASAPYTHTFALLNTGSAQPVTHTITDYTGITATVGARAFPFICMTDLTLNVNAEELFTWEGKALGMIGAPASAAPTPSLSGLAAPVPAWRAQIGIGGPATGGTQVMNVSEASVTFTRKVVPQPTANGAPDPYTFARGVVAVSGKFKHVAADESPLLNMLNNVQPQLQIVIDNGTVGAGQVNLQVDVLKGAYKATKTAFGEVFVYDVEWDAVANTTNVGASAGYGPAKVTLKNAVTTY
jgi:hypothetical protein